MHVAAPIAAPAPVQLYHQLVSITSTHSLGVLDVLGSGEGVVDGTVAIELSMETAAARLEFRSGVQALSCQLLHKPISVPSPGEKSKV